jgi:tetratricopeptide (TPR) repeat protein
LQNALAAFTRARDLLAKQPASYLIAVAHYGRGQAYESLGPDDVETLERALAECVASYESSRTAGRPLNQGTAAYHVGRVLVEIAERSGNEARLTEAIPYLEEAERTYRAARLDDNEADAAHLLQRARQGRNEKSGEQSSPATDRLDQTSHEAGEQPSESAADRMPPEARAQAMQGIRSSQFRAVFLQKWIEHHVSADPERYGFLRRSIFEPGMSEALATSQEAERQGDPELHKLAEEKARDAQMYFEYLLESDRANSTHAAALGILRNHLESGQAFILFLRNFDIDISKGRVPMSKEHLFNPDRFPLKHVNVIAVHGSFEQARLAEAIPEQIPIVAISDIGDVFQMKSSRRIARLRVLANEWDLVAAMLIGEAAAIVLFSHGLSESLETELNLVKDLGVAQRMSVLLARPSDADDPLQTLFREDDKDARKLSFAVLYESLQKRFEERLVQIEEFPKDEEEIRRIAEKAIAPLSR